MEDNLNLIKRGIDELLTEKELLSKLKSKKQCHNIGVGYERKYEKNEPSDPPSIAIDSRSFILF